MNLGSERTKVRKVSQGLLSLRRALNLQDDDFTAYKIGRFVRRFASKNPLDYPSEFP